MFVEINGYNTLVTILIIIYLKASFQSVFYETVYCVNSIGY